MTLDVTSPWHQLLSAAHVWHVDPEAIDAQRLEHQCIHWLSGAEIQHLNRLQRTHVRHEYLVTRVLCRWALSRYARVRPEAWEFSIVAKSKPCVAGPVAYRSLRFNLTHTYGLVACAVTRAGKIGIDAEPRSRLIEVDDLAKIVLSPAEQERLAKLASPQRNEAFLKHWVLKEAYLKGRGTGLFLAPEQVTLRFKEDGQPTPIGRWQLSLTDVAPAHIAAVAVRDRLGQQVQVGWHRAELSETVGGDCWQ